MSMLYHFGDFTLDEERYELRRGRAVIALEPKGFQVLRYLLQQRDRVVPRDELFAQCWPGTFVSDWALTRCLARIRKALGDGHDGTQMIKTVHGQGYRFVAPLTETPRTSAPLWSLTGAAPACAYANAYTPVSTAVCGAGALYAPCTTKHALIQDAAYQSLLRRTRQQAHHSIAQVLAARFPAAVETQPELVAQHYTAAGCHAQAVVYWQRAGQHTSDRSAYLEAISKKHPAPWMTASR